MSEPVELKPKVSRKLNVSQVAILENIYRFRFGSSNLVANSLRLKSGKYIFRRLKLLVEHGYLERNFDSSYRIKGQPASYFLLPRAMRLLQKLGQQKGLTDQAIKNSYNDKDVASGFIDHSLSVYAINNQLAMLYPAIQQFTKRELAIYKYFPKRLPDLYLSLNVKNDTRRYFLDLIEITDKPFAINWQLGLMANYFQNGEWQAKGNPFPVILYVCETGELEKRIRRQVNAAVYKFGVEIQFYTTTQNALMRSTQNDDEIWSSTTEPEKLVALGEF